jgi:hypothetical protein
MQALVLEEKVINTKFGEKRLVDVQLATGEVVKLWEKPDIEAPPVNAMIEVETTVKGGYKRILGALVGKDKKKAMVDYAISQSKYLAFLHNTVKKEFAEQGIELNNEIIEKYAVTIYIGAKKEFNL